VGSLGAESCKRSGRSFRPRLEILEDRTLLSVCTVDRLTDNNPPGGGREGANGMGDFAGPCLIRNGAPAELINDLECSLLQSRH